MVTSILILFTVATSISFVKLSNFFVKIINLFAKKPEDRISLKHSIFLISLMGATYHTYFIFKETVINSFETDIVYKYSFANYNRLIPSIVFCLSIDSNLEFEPNEIVTGNLMEEKTKDLNESYLFEKIVYFDYNAKKHFWKPYLNTSSNLKINHFFFLTFKCFQIKYRMNSNHIRNYIINTILEIKFNTATIKHENYLLITKLSHTDDFSSHLHLPFNQSYRLYFNAFNNSFQNQYQTLINPKLWFQKGYKINDVTFYMDQLR